MLFVPEKDCCGSTTLWLQPEKYCRFRLCRPASCTSSRFGPLCHRTACKQPLLFHPKGRQSNCFGWELLDRQRLHRPRRNHAQRRQRWGLLQFQKDHPPDPAAVARHSRCFESGCPGKQEPRHRRSRPKTRAMHSVLPGNTVCRCPLRSQMRPVSGKHRAYVS